MPQHSMDAAVQKHLDLEPFTAIDAPRVLCHAIGMGGFYYSAAAFAPPD